MTYKVLSEFIEEGHLYKVGASYPAEGVEIEDERADYLADASKNGAISFIEKVKPKITDDERYKKVNVDQLKEMLEKAEIEIPENAKKPELFALAVEKTLIV